MQHRSRHAQGALVACCLLVAAVGTLTGCPSYSERIADARMSVIRGQPDQGIIELNEALKVNDAKELPRKLNSDDTLVLLERATMLQAQGLYKLSARDMIIADQRLEWFDIGSSDAKQIGRYLYSDDATDYRAPPYERLLLNTLNMINFLALGELNGARVEARRFSIMESFYIDSTTGRALLPGMLALGNYLGGMTFESSFEYTRAVRYYTKAWRYGMRTPRLRQRLFDLYRLTGWRPKEVRDAFLAKLIDDAQAADTLLLEDYQQRYQRGDTLVVVQTGVAPYKRAERMTIGNALARTQRNRRQAYRMSAGDVAFTTSLASRGVLTYVAIPSLTRDGLPRRWRTRLVIDAAPQRLVQGMDVATQVEAAWLRVLGPVIASAVVRAVARVVAGEATRQATKAATQGQAGAGGAEALGLLASLAVQGAMAARDTPDTRSWTSLPARIELSRMNLDQGPHQVTLQIGNRRDRKMAAIWADRPNVINFSRLR